MTKPTRMINHFKSVYWHSADSDYIYFCRFNLLVYFWRSEREWTGNGFSLIYLFIEWKKHFLFIQRSLGHTLRTPRWEQSSVFISKEYAKLVVHCSEFVNRKAIKFACMRTCGHCPFNLCHHCVNLSAHFSPFRAHNTGDISHSHCADECRVAPVQNAHI